MQRRFWSKVDIDNQQTGFGITLDGRGVKTPGKATLVVPTAALARVIAREWDAVGEQIDPNQMPATRSANSAIDKVAAQHHEIAGLIAAYGETDLICHRADSPARLAERQAESWDPWLDWTREDLGAPLLAGIGVMHIDQPKDSLRVLEEHVRACDAFRLTGLHDLVTLSGSLILGLAVAKRRIGWEEAWIASSLEETWQQEQWGIDDEAAVRQSARRDAFQFADTWLKLLDE